MTDAIDHSGHVQVLVVYYSRTGRTRALAETVAHLADADIEPLRNSRKRTGRLGWALSLLDALRCARGRIEPPACDPTEYDLVLIGTPVWADGPAPPARAFARDCGGQCKHVAFFATHWGPQPGRTFGELAELADQLPVGTLSVAASQVGTDACEHRAREFVRRVCSAASAGRVRV
jgi:flavodoxin